MDVIGKFVLEYRGLGDITNTSSRHEHSSITPNGCAVDVANNKNRGREK